MGFAKKASYSFVHVVWVPKDKQVWIFREKFLSKQCRLWSDSLTWYKYHVIGNWLVPGTWWFRCLQVFMRTNIVLCIHTKTELQGTASITKFVSFQQMAKNWGVPINPFYIGRLFHCYMLDESICNFGGAGCVLFLLFYFWWKIL